MADPLDVDPALRLAAFGRDLDRLVAAQVGGRERLLGRGKFRQGAGEEKAAAEVAASGAEIDDMIGGADDRLLVLDD